MASLGLGWVGENAANELIQLAFAGLPPAWAGPVAEGIGLAVAFALITSLHIILGEQTPKIVALSAADRVALSSAPIIHAFDRALRPFIALLDNATAFFAHLLGVPSAGAHQTVYTVEELKQLISETQQRGELEASEKEMIHNVFEFGDRFVREVMIPRPEMVAFEEHTTIGEFLQTFTAESHARFPIYAETIDNITGFIAIKDILRALAQEGDAVRARSVRELARPATFVPELKRVGSLFAEMQAQKTQLAIVIDEYGGTAGMVTVEELIEEIVGRVSDELAQEPPAVEAIDENTSLVDAAMRVEEVNEQLGLSLPEKPDYETVAGLALDALRHIPREGEQFRIRNVRITITRMDGLRIDQVQIKRL
jgi:CBS domain containing-hemolysin-like protein